MSPVLTGKFYTSEPPGKPLEILFLKGAHKNFKRSGTQRRSSHLKGACVKPTCWSWRDFKSGGNWSYSLGQTLAAAILGSLFYHVDTGAGKSHFDINVGTPLAKQLIRHECSPTHQQIGFLKTPLAHCLPLNIPAHEHAHTTHKKRPVYELALPLAGQHKFQENSGPTEKFVRNWPHPPAILHLL